MKIRKGFVTNSSSSSFVIDKKHLTITQVAAIKDHTEFARENCPQEDFYYDYPWTIEDMGSEEYGAICGNTWMDNFNMYRFLEIIGVDMSNVRWSH